MKTNKNKLLLASMIGVSLISISATGAFAQGSDGSKEGNGPNISAARNMGQRGAMMKNVNSIGGTVTAINGNIITLSVQSRKMMTPPVAGTTPTPPVVTTTTVTVDATNAKIQKAGGVVGTIADIKVGDRISVQSATSTAGLTNVVATAIMDGGLQQTNNDGAPGMMNQNRGIIGTVNSISGNIISITSTSKTVYTVDATNAVIKKVTMTTPVTPLPVPTQGENAKWAKPAETTITASGIAVGDTISVQGTTTGTNIVAKTITDGVRIGMINKGQEQGQNQEQPQAKRGVFQKIGDFFRGMFGKKNN